MSDIIKIQNEVFKNTYLSGRFNDNSILKSKFITIEEIIKTDVFIPARKIVNSNLLPSSRKVSAFNCKFSREDKAKKELFSLLNKLTISNADKIIPKVSIIEPYEPLFYIVIDFIKSNKKYFELYIKVLNLFPKEWLSNKLHVVFNDNIDYWLIPANFINIDIYSNSCDYDMYCDYNKWKDSVLVLTLLYLYYEKKMEIVAKNIHKHIIKYLSSNKTYMRHLIDPYIEQLKLLHKWINVSELNQIQKYELPSSSKFKIMNLHEIKNSS